MHATRWNKKRVITIVVAVLVLYTIFSSGYNKYAVDVTINNAHPESVWEYIADFSKMRLLNPTILDFTVIADHGTPDHWKYSVQYRERLSHWPYWVNNAVAHYAVRKDTPADGGAYLVESEHQTCFFLGLYCLRSTGEFKCLPSGVTSTYCIETVYYQCPPFLGSFCRREVEFQRRAIMKNLTYQISQKQ